MLGSMFARMGRGVGWLLLCVGLLSGVYGYSQEVEWIRQEGDSAVLEVRFAAPTYSRLEVEGIGCLLPRVGGAVYNAEQGMPELPVVSVSLLLGRNAFVIARVVESEQDTLRGVTVAPSRGAVTRDVDLQAVQRHFGAVYSQPSFHPASAISLGQPYQQGEVHGCALRIWPVRCNPVSRELVVTRKLRIALKGLGVQEGGQVFGDKIPSRFANVPEGAVRSASGKSARLGVENPLLLVVSPRKYVGNLKPLVEWKRQRGLRVELCVYGELNSGVLVNDTVTLKRYIEGRYKANVGLKYVLLVGNRYDVHPLRRKGRGYGLSDSDIAYGQLRGQDSYSEVYVGRFSVSTPAELDIMVRRTIAYERDVKVGDTWLSGGLTISSAREEGIGDNGETDPEHALLMRRHLLSGGYAHVDTLFDAQGKLVSAEMVRDILNRGVGVVTYTGHGGYQDWVTSRFSVADVSQLTNTRAWPFIFDVACDNGRMQQTPSPCLAEALTRASLQGHPTGVLAINACSDLQDWASPMAAQDAMVDYISGHRSTVGITENGQLTYGALTANAVGVMLDKYNDMVARNTADTWNLFGDPTVFLRTTPPRTMSVHHPDTLHVGASEFLLQCDVDGALAVLTVRSAADEARYYLGRVVGGVAQLQGLSVTSGDSAVLTVTAPNRQTVVERVEVADTSSYPFTFKNVELKGKEGEILLKCAPGDEATVHADLCYRGDEASSGPLSLSCRLEPASLGSVTLDSQPLPVFPPNKCSEHLRLATLKISETAKDGAKGVVKFTIRENGRLVGFYSRPISVVRPELSIDSVAIVADGSGDGRVEAGETLTLKVWVRNAGQVVLPSNKLLFTIAGLEGYQPLEKGYPDLGVGKQAELRVELKFPSPLPSVNSLVLSVQGEADGGTRAELLVPIPLTQPYQRGSAFFTGFPFGIGQEGVQVTRFIVPSELLGSDTVITAVQIPLWLMADSVGELGAIFVSASATSSSSLDGVQPFDPHSVTPRGNPAKVSYNRGGQIATIPIDIIQRRAGENLLVTIYSKVQAGSYAYGVKAARRQSGQVDIWQSTDGKEYSLTCSLVAPRLTTVAAQLADVELTIGSKGRRTVQNLKLEIDGHPYQVRADGKVKLQLLEGDYTVMITTENCKDIVETLSVRGARVEREYQLSPIENIQIQIEVATRTGEKLQGASVTLNGEAKLVDASGKAVFEGSPGVYPLQIDAEGYQSAHLQIVVQKEAFKAKYNLVPRFQNALDAVENDPHVEIAPNPVRDQLTVIVPFPLRGVAIYSGVGIECHRVAAQGRKTVLDVSALSPGLYLVEVLGEAGERALARFVKQ